MDTVIKLHYITHGYTQHTYVINVTNVFTFKLGMV